MDCSICLSAITAATGVYTTSCGHTFHFRCAVTWLVHAEVENCPMCRHEMGDDERLPEEDHEHLTEDEEEEEDDDEEDEDDEETIPRFDAETHAFWVLRKTFQMLDDNESIVPELARADLPKIMRSLVYRNGRLVQEYRIQPPPRIPSRPSGRELLRRLCVDDGYDTA